MLSYNATMEVLINAVDIIRKKLNISLNDYPIDLFKIIENYPDLKILEKPFTSPAFGGFIIRNKLPYPSIIILNSNISYIDKNFALGHELIHYFCHPDEVGSKVLALSHKNTLKFNAEKQANEGSAELLIPAKLFIPEIKTAIEYYQDKQKAFEETAKIYNVAPDVIKFRYYNLKLNNR